MTEANLNSHRRRLLTLASRLQSEVASRRGDALGAGPDGDDPIDRPVASDDLARREAVQEVTAAQLASEEQIAAQIEAALARIADGTFGVCPECGKPIPEARLRAVPYARFCTACTRRHEVDMVP